MKRFMMKQLFDWKNSPYRKPLILKGGQQSKNPDETLIIFDEIQDCPKVINSMKYFCENAPEYHVACAAPCWESHCPSLPLFR